MTQPENTRNSQWNKWIKDTDHWKQSDRHSLSQMQENFQLKRVSTFPIYSHIQFATEIHHS